MNLLSLSYRLHCLSKLNQPVMVDRLEVGREVGGWSGGWRLVGRLEVGWEVGGWLRG